jgi:hypothetical protein
MTEATMQVSGGKVSLAKLAVRVAKSEMKMTATKMPRVKVSPVQTELN